MNTRIGTTTTLGRIIRLRPLAVADLEKVGRYRLWDNLNLTLGEFCLLAETDEQALLASLRQLTPARIGIDWRTKPIYHLIDHLTAEHDAFCHKHMPNLHRLLDVEQAPALPDRFALRPLQMAFGQFDRDFRAHMNEEEDFLFPKIMRNEACFRYRELSPEVYKGSVNLYLSTHTHPAEEEFRRTFTELRDAARGLKVQESMHAHLVEAVEALEAFGARLIAHACLEEEELFPRAGRLEQELYESAAPGVSRYPERGRGAE